MWLAAALALLVTRASGALAQPYAFSPALAVTKSGEPFMPLSLSGTGFGLPHPQAWLFVSVPGQNMLFFSSSDPNIAVWNDKQIVVKLPPSTVPLQVAVSRPNGQTTWVHVDLYRYDAFATTTTGGTLLNGVAVDASGRAWTIEEYHTELKYWDPSQSSVVKAACAECATPYIQPSNIPHANSPGAYIGLNGSRTWQSSDGEGIEVDSLGRVWFVQGGLGSNNTTLPNHSRIVSYDPAAGVPEQQRYKIWNVPGDHNEATQVAWDAPRGALWFAEQPRKLCNGNDSACGPALHPARLVKFLPDGNAGWLPPNNQFNFDAFADMPNVNCAGFSQNTYPTPPVPGTCTNGQRGQQCYGDHDCVQINQVCGPTPWTFLCYKAYDIADARDIERMVVDASGRVWFANYSPLDRKFAVGRLDPADGTVLHFPVAPTPRYRSSAHLYTGHGAWDIEMTASGDVVFSEYFAVRIARVNGSQVETNPQCQQLLWPDGSDCTATPDPSCTNPCIHHLELPNPCDLNSNGECSTPCALLYGNCPALYGCFVNGAGACVSSFDKVPREIELHPDGTTWFTEEGPSQSATTTTTIGIINQNWDQIVLFPPFSLFDIRFQGQFWSFEGSGLSINPNGGNPPAPEIWFADSSRRQVSRLRKIS